MDKFMEIKDPEYVYSGGNAALKGINVDIYRGQRLAVLGANGAGKSTFFLNLNGVLKPTRGRILCEGHPVSYDRKGLLNLRKNVGIVFQDPDNQIFASTVYGEVSFGAMNLRLPKEEVAARTEQAMEYMDITAFKNRPPHYLSGGEKKRVSIADILVMNPQMIIFDEPTAALDPMNAQNLEKILKKLCEEGMTITLSTHDVDFAYRWAERILVFADGEIIGDDIPENIFRNKELLGRANLKVPAVFTIYEALKARGVLNGQGPCPRDVETLEKLIME